MTKTVNGVLHYTIGEMQNRFDFNHYSAVRAARRAQGIEALTPPPVMHVTTGSQYIRPDGSAVVIERVSKHWFLGYYYYALFRVMGTDSHGTTVVENISTVDSGIVNLASEFTRWKKIE